MKIKHVTLTGADDTVKPGQLFELSSKYPFVEWGILLSRNRQGLPRFPSKNWLMELLTEKTPGPLNFAGHLCGGFVRELLLGESAFINEIGPVWGLFDRIQINTHGQTHAFNLEALNDILSRYPEKEFIFQYDNRNVELFLQVTEKNKNVSALFDRSHGAGVLPDEWPAPLPGVKCGYAGGLSPVNIAAQLDRLALELPPDMEIWVDMETRLRSSDDRYFELQKATSVLETCAPRILGPEYLQTIK